MPPVSDVVLSETLAPHPASVGRARRLIGAALADASLHDLVDVAMLLVSEVVTNSVLHAGTEIHLRCRRRGDVVRVEVFDRSPQLPSVRHFQAEAATGRGLALVSRLAAAWGVMIHDVGKTLWFDLGNCMDLGPPPERPPTAESAPPAGPPLTTQLLNASPSLLLATIEQGEALLRELTLLVLGGELDHDVPGGWHPSRFDVAPILAAAEAAAGGERRNVDIEVGLPAGADTDGIDRLRLIDHADSLARAGRLLSAPALPEVGACRHWLYMQIAEQAGGFPPQRWELPQRLEPSRVAAVIPACELKRLRTVAYAAVVADDANRIIFANTAACELLGWTPQELVGQRLTVLIPAELREAHLAGFTRLQMTGKSRVLGSRLNVPALRRDGSSIEVVLTITEVSGVPGRSAFCAVLAPASGATGEVAFP